MLQDIRNSTQSTAAKVVVGLIVVTFALFGVESIVGGLSGEPEVATVNGEDIPESRFKRALEGKRRQILAQMGERADPDLIDESLLRTSVLEGMINEEILAQDADEKGLYVSEAAVDSYIRNVDQFKVDGEFSNERMQLILRNAGLTLKDYRDSLRKQFMLNQPRSALIASAFVLNPEQQEIVALDRQSRTFGVATVYKRDYLDAISVGDDEVESYYQENKENYKKPENVDVSYLLVDKRKLADSVEISEEDVRSLYEVEKETYVGEESRHAAHILIQIDEDTDAQQALDKIKEVEAKLAEGASFEALAKEYSEDEGSAAAGGDLGVSARGVYVSDFEDVLFSLETGVVSQPVKTEFGYHLIKLLAIEQNDIPEFEEMQASLTQRLKDERADRLYVDMIEQLADISYSAPDLTEPAEELGLDIKELAGVSKESRDNIFSNVKVQRILFDQELLQDKNNSEVIELDDDRAIVFRVEAYHEESVLPLEQVKERVRDTLIAQKAQEYAASVGQAFLARVEAGEEPGIVSEDMGLDWQVYDDITRDNIMINREVVSHVFAMEPSTDRKDQLEGFEVLDGDFSVVMLQEVKDGDISSVSAIEKRSIRDMIGDSYGAGDYRNYQQVMTRDAEIERI